MRMELTILRNLIHNEDYVRKTLPFLKKEYFQDSSEREVFYRIQEFVTKYNSKPSREAIGLDIESNNKLSEDEHKRSMELVRELNEPEPTDMQWLLDNTEQFCQDRAIYNGIMDSIAILDGKDKKCYHVFCRDGKGNIVCTARILHPGVSYPEVSIGRVVVDETVRKNGVGHELLKKCSEFIKEEFGDVSVSISAQKHLEKFYNKHNFISVGNEYLEDGIPHLEMKYTGKN